MSRPASAGTCNGRNAWAAYANMYAALIVMSLLCSGAITLLFRTRDRLLIWQKGVVKW